VSRSFVHLHNHTHYSLLDGAQRIDEMVETAKRAGMPAIAMTDHGNLFGAVEFYETAKAQKVKPILGIEAYVNPGPLSARPDGKRVKDYYHLVLLAENETGWRNLMKLSSRAYLEGYYYKPRVDRAMLETHAEGLIALSGCLSGEVNEHLRADRFDEAREAAAWHRDVFGVRYFLELQAHGLAEEERVLPRLVDLGREMGLPMVATNDSHYLCGEHAHAHEALLCIQTGKTLADPDRMKFGTHEMYLKTPEQMYALFSGLERAVETSLQIAERCNVAMEFGSLKLPHFPAPPGFDSLDAYLLSLSEAGLQERYGDPTHELRERLRFELDVIRQMGYAGYFLIVQDFIRHARSVGVPVGPGRGSAAGSIVSYCLGITNIDPIRYQLLFERFLNPERISMPDIDVDFSDRGRAQVIKYVVEKYGADNVCQIITFGTMAARAAVRDVGRVMGVPYSEVDKIAKMVPAEIGIKLDQALEKSPDLKAIYKADENVRAIIDTARVLEGLARHSSTHAAGVVITPTPLTDYVPLLKTNEDEITTQFDMGACEKIGLLKMDFLGLRTLTVLQDCEEMLARRGVVIDLDALPLDDLESFALLSRGETVGIFQFESSGMTDYLRKLRPECLEDMIAMNALYRPGPLGSGMVDDFIQRKQGAREIAYEHPLLEPILKETYGVIVYQEQVMQIASVLAGYSLGEADLLRRAMGKKKKEVMDEQRAGFVERAVTRGVAGKDAAHIFDLMAHFAGYGFNKSHSAGYALVAYQTAFLKAHYPLEFMAAAMTSEMSNSDRIMIFLAECRRLGLAILPPDVNQSEEGFTPSGAESERAIRFGLGAVKGIGHNAVEAIRAGRAEGPYRDLFDLCARIDAGVVNRKSLEALITSGALDTFGQPRARLLEGLPLAMEWSIRRRREQEMGQGSLFGGGAAPGESVAPELPEAPEWIETERLAKEKAALGFYVSGHPLDAWRRRLLALGARGTHELEGLDDGSKVIVGGLPIATKISLDRKGQPLCFLTLEDFTGVVEGVVFAEPFGRCRAHLTGDQPILLEARVSTREAEKPKLLISNAWNLASQVEGGELALHLGIATASSDEEFDALRRLLCAHPGASTLFLHVDARKLGGVIVRSRGLRVAVTEELCVALAGWSPNAPLRLTVGAPPTFRSSDIFGDTRVSRAAAARRELERQEREAAESADDPSNDAAQDRTMSAV